MGKTFRRWLPFAFVITMLCGLVYVAVQQAYRQEANDPQVQMVEDAAIGLGVGGKPQTLFGSTDIARGLEPWMAIYDDSGKPLAFSGTLDGNAPELPNGVLESARVHGESRLTWQPRGNVRQAIVIIHYGGPDPGFVVAGRNLREVEAREAQLTFFAGLAWFISLVGSFVLLWVF